MKFAQNEPWAPVIGSFTPFLPKTLKELEAERKPFNAVMGNTKDEGSPFCSLMNYQNSAYLKKIKNFQPNLRQV